MKSIIDRLTNSPVPYEVRINNKGYVSYDEDEQVIHWDPNSGLCLKNFEGKLTGQGQSPSMGLGHELDHAANQLRGVRYSQRIKPYGTPEEKRVIEGSENAAAWTLNEGIRHNHFGLPVTVKNATQIPSCDCQK